MRRAGLVARQVARRQRMPAGAPYPCQPGPEAPTRIIAGAQQEREHGGALALGRHGAEVGEGGRVAARRAQRPQHRRVGHHSHRHVRLPHASHQALRLVSVRRLRAGLQGAVEQRRSVVGVPCRRRARRRRRHRVLLAVPQQPQHLAELAARQGSLHALAGLQRGGALRRKRGGRRRLGGGGGRGGRGDCCPLLSTRFDGCDGCRRCALQRFPGAQELGCCPAARR